MVIMVETPYSEMLDGGDIQSVVLYNFINSDSVASEIQVPVPLPEYVNVDEFVAKVGAAGGLAESDASEVACNINKLVLDEIGKINDERDDLIITNALAKGRISFDEYYSSKPNEPVLSQQMSFADQFNCIMHNSPCDHLTLLMKKEIEMAAEMSHLLRARTWEVEQLTEECENLLRSSESNDMHPHQLSKLNEKLRQVHGSYACQIEALAEQQRKHFKAMVEAVYQAKGNTLNLPEDIASDFQAASNTSYSCPQSVVSTIDESFTIYIGAQLKSMHNVRIVTAPDLVSLVVPQKIDDIGGRLQLAMSLYGRSLTAVILLVPKDPMHHINMQSDFFKACEHSTELHFEPLSAQLRQIAESTKNANIWRGGNCPVSTDVDANVPSNTRTDSSLAVGDVYITKHSNLRQSQIVFHLVVDEQLQTTEISSRHACFNGLRNIIRLTTKLGITSVFLPLLLIDKPSETSTVTWCLRRAEMVYKCVKGYLMEVCGSACGGSSAPVPHYNINFVLPAGLSASIYEQILSMLPSIFHLVPNVTATDD